MTYHPRYFRIEELVPPAVASARGELAWQLLDERMLVTLDQLRAEFGPVIVNTWGSERLIRQYGLRQWSGLRTLEYWTTKYGADLGLKRYAQSYSQHKYGRAFDALFQDYTAEAVREAVREKPGRFPHLKAMETQVSWFHGDVRNVKPLLEFAP